jgi:nitrogen fixation NifU-like protein
MSTQGYDDLILDHIKNARNYHAPDVFDRRASGTNPLCGDEMIVFVKLESDAIADVAFQCTCCGISMASASVMTELIKGETTAEATRILGDFVIALKTPGASVPAALGPASLALVDTIRRFPARVRCAMLPWVTLEGALNDAHEVAVVP